MKNPSLEAFVDFCQGNYENNPYKPCTASHTAYAVAMQKWIKQGQLEQENTQ
jgi:hypothetical protein